MRPLERHAVSVVDVVWQVWLAKLYMHMTPLASLRCQYKFKPCIHSKLCLTQAAAMLACRSQLRRIPCAGQSSTSVASQVSLALEHRQTAFAWPVLACACVSAELCIINDKLICSWSDPPERVQALCVEISTSSLTCQPSCASDAYCACMPSACCCYSLSGQTCPQQPDRMQALLEAAGYCSEDLLALCRRKIKVNTALQL